MKYRFLISVALILIALWTALFFYGNPLTRNKSIETVETYVEANYPENAFQISDVNFYPGEDTFIVRVISKDGKMTGNIDVKNGKITNEEFSDPVE